MPEPFLKRIPSDYAIVLARMARDHGVDLLEDVQMTVPELEAADFIPLAAYVDLLERYTSLQTEPDWGFRLGLRFSMESHGALGFGAVSAATIRDGLVFLARYIPTRTSYLHATLVQAKGSLQILFRHDAIMGPFVRRSCETLSVVFQSFIESAGGSGVPLVWRFPYPEPEHSAAYGRWLHGSFTFAADTLRLEVPGSVAMIQSAFRNEAAFKATLAQCEALLNESGTETFSDRTRAILNGHIERRILESVPVTDIPAADEVARQLGVSRRTLIRRLKQSGTSFQTLKDDALREHLPPMLARPELTLTETGHRLGYADPANFTRACRRVFDETPRALRKRLTAR